MQLSLLIGTILFGVIMEKKGEQPAQAFFIGFLFTFALGQIIINLIGL